MSVKYKELIDPNNLMTPDEVAKDLNIADITLRVWRGKDYGPTFIKLGNRIFYKKNDILNFKRGVEFANRKPGPKKD